MTVPLSTHEYKWVQANYQGNQSPCAGLHYRPIQRVMLDIPSQYMHYCLVLLCEVYCVIV